MLLTGNKSKPVTRIAVVGKTAHPILITARSFSKSKTHVSNISRSDKHGHIFASLLFYCHHILFSSPRSSFTLFSTIVSSAIVSSKVVSPPQSLPDFLWFLRSCRFRPYFFPCLSLSLSPSSGSFLSPPLPVRVFFPVSPRLHHWRIVF